MLRSILRFAVLITMPVLLPSCKIPQRSLAIVLEETPLYPEKQWAVVNMPYIKVSEGLSPNHAAGLLGMVRFSNIVEVQRVQESIKDQTMWAYVVWNPEIQDRDSVQGWVPYDFLRMMGNRKEAKLARHQMLQPELAVLD